MTAVEVAMLSIIFFSLVFATLELARSIYLFNTLQEVTRRTASEVARRSPMHPDSAEITDIKRQAMFKDKGDNLALGAPVTVAHIRVEYQSLIRSPGGAMQRVTTAPLPTCSTANRRICMANPNDPGCIRFVRVQICAPDGAAACTPVVYQPVFPLFPFDVKLPRASTIVTVEALGYRPDGGDVCL